MFKIIGDKIYFRDYMVAEIYTKRETIRRDFVEALENAVAKETAVQMIDRIHRLEKEILEADLEEIASAAW